MNNNRLVIKIGAKQFLVKPGDKIVADRLRKAEGEVFELNDLLSNELVKLKVVAHTLGKKINGLKFKNKIHYLRRYGHRQTQTILEVLSAGKEAPKSSSAKAEKVEAVATARVASAGKSVKEKRSSTTKKETKPVSKAGDKEIKSKMGDSDKTTKKTKASARKVTKNEA